MNEMFDGKQMHQTNAHLDRGGILPLALLLDLLDLLGRNLMECLVCIILYKCVIVEKSC